MSEDVAACRDKRDEDSLSEISLSREVGGLCSFSFEDQRR